MEGRIQRSNSDHRFMVDAAGNVLSVDPFGAEQLAATPSTSAHGDSVLKVLHLKMIELLR